MPHGPIEDLGHRLGAMKFWFRGRSILCVLCVSEGSGIWGPLQRSHEEIESRG